MYDYYRFLTIIKSYIHTKDREKNETLTLVVIKILNKYYSNFFPKFLK
jgi:hypothetical protein